MAFNDRLISDNLRLEKILLRAKYVTKLTLLTKSRGIVYPFYKGERIRLYFGITRMVPSLLFQHCQSQALKTAPTSFNQ